MHLIQTTDFFYALIDDPYTMGRITCCNVLSDLFAMGVTHCDNMLLLLGIPTSMNPEERSVTSRLIMEGFRDCAAEAGTSIRGGQTVQNPWLMLGGVATSVCKPGEFLMPDRAVPGDALILTKPQGTQVAVNIHQWMEDEHAFWLDKLQPAGVQPEEVKRLFLAATHSMARLNLAAARLMRQLDAHACTDVTGFGLYGHALNLVKVQKQPLAFHIDRMPVLRGTPQLSRLLDDRFGLFKGLTPETSGGLLIALPEPNARQFCDQLRQTDGHEAWIIGRVEEASEKAVHLSPDLQLIEC